MRPEPRAGCGDLASWCDQAASWPLPGEGRTGERFARLAALARADLVLGRLVEAHADAMAITAELGGPGPAAGQRWGVWAAGPPDAVRGEGAGGGWRLDGTKQWCSGAGLLDHALVDAATADGQRLFAVDLGQPGVAPGPPSWVGPGMRGADTRAVSFRAVPGVPVGQPGQYLTRPGFWAGAAGVAACWHGGTMAVADALLDRCRTDSDPYQMAHLGAVYTALCGNWSALEWVAEAIDREPGADHQVSALAVRSTVERHAVEVMDRVGRALGPAPLAHDPRHAATVADLTVYVRQHHAERDLAEIGRRIAERPDPWST